MKCEVVFYSAVSVDGYIAKANPISNVAWLDEFNEKIGSLDSDDKIKGSYGNFISDVTTIICGAKTYQDILGFGVEWPYQDYDTYVVSTRADSLQDENVKAFIPYQKIKEIIEDSKGKVYILGGGNLAGQLMDDQLITKLILTQMPVLLGSGVKYFQNKEHQQLKLMRVDKSADFVELEYDIIYHNC